MAIEDFRLLNSEEQRVQDLLIAMGHRKDQELATVSRRMSDWVPVINIGQRRKIKERFKAMRDEIESQEAIMNQLRERLDRAKREQR